MGRLLLCRGTEGKHPYYVKKLGINLYTAEELSYYIYHHAFFLDDSFLNEDLYQFLSQECRMPALEKKLRSWAEEGTDFVSMMLLIQQEIHYYTDFELISFKENLTRICKASDTERIKWQADYMMEQKKYESALRMYDNALRLEEQHPDLRLRSLIFCNRGAVYAQLFAFREAAECYEKAYELQGGEEILNRIFVIYQLDPSLPIKESLMDKIPAEKQRMWKEELDVMQKRCSYSGKALEAREILEKNSVRRGAELEKLLVSWKQEYRKVMA